MPPRFCNGASKVSLPPNSESLYADPALYDAIYAQGTDDETWLLTELAAPGVEKSVLEPACGTGRYLKGFLRRGWTAHGYDSSPRMVSFARKEIARWPKIGRVDAGDMRTYIPRQRYGLIFNLTSTFRHLATDRDALAHLRRCAEALLPNGRYILGIDLTDYDSAEDDEETWVITHRGRRLRQVQIALAPTRKNRKETVLNFITEPKRKMREMSHDLRSYDIGELTQLVAKSGLLIDHCVDLTGREVDCKQPRLSGSLWIVLKHRSRP